MKDLLRLIRLLRPYSGMVLLSVICGLATIAAGVGLLATSAYLLSAAALRPSIADLQVAIVGVRFFGLSRGVFRYLERLTSHSVNFRLLSALRVDFYRALEPLAPGGLQDERAGDLLTRAVSDIETLQDFYVRAFAPVIVAVLASAGMALFLGAYSPSLAVTLLSFLAVTGLLLPWLTRRLARDPSRRLVAARASLNAALVDSVQGQADLLVFGREQDQLDRLSALEGDFLAAQRRLNAIQASLTGLTQLLINLGGLAVLWAAVPLVTAGQIAGVSLALLVLGSLSAFEAVQPLPQAAQQTQASLAAARRLFELTDRPAPVRAPAIPLRLSADRRPAGLSVRALRVRYAADLPWALDGLDLDLPAGKRLALVGASGSGKTTLAYVLTRLLEYQSGQVCLDGLELRDCLPQDVRERVSLVAQHSYLFSGSLEQNLRLANPQATGAQIDAALRLAQLAEWNAALPEGLATQIGERGLRLSGGERQRLALAQAILRGAPLWIFDEPTANLDAATEHSLLAALFPALEDRSLLYITHRLASLERMDEICVLEAGRIVERGTHNRLVGAGGPYQRLWDAQRRILAEYGQEGRDQLILVKCDDCCPRISVRASAG